MVALALPAPGRVAEGREGSGAGNVRQNQPGAPIAASDLLAISLASFRLSCFSL